MCRAVLIWYFGQRREGDNVVPNENLNIAQDERYEARPQRIVRSGIEKSIAFRARHKYIFNWNSITADKFLAKQDTRSLWKWDNTLQPDL